MPVYLPACIAIYIIIILLLNKIVHESCKRSLRITSRAYKACQKNCSSPPPVSLNYVLFYTIFYLLQTHTSTQKTIFSNKLRLSSALWVCFSMLYWGGWCVLCAPFMFQVTGTAACCCSMSDHITVTEDHPFNTLSHSPCSCAIFFPPNFCSFHCEDWRCSVLFFSSREFRL